MEAPPRVTVIGNCGQNAHYWLPVYQQWRSNFTVLTKHAIFTVRLTLGNTTLHLPCKTTYLQQHSTSHLTRNTRSSSSHDMDLSRHLSVLMSGLPLTDVFCYISVIVLVGLHPIGWTIQKESFLFLESGSGNFRASVKVLLWWYLIERDINTYRSFCWLWAMWTYSNAQCPCFNLCSDVCVHFSLISLHFQSSILTCAADKI